MNEIIDRYNNLFPLYGLNNNFSNLRCITGKENKIFYYTSLLLLMYVLFHQKRLMHSQKNSLMNLSLLLMQVLHK